MLTAEARQEVELGHQGADGPVWKGAELKVMHQDCTGQGWAHLVHVGSPALQSSCPLIALESVRGQRGRVPPQPRLLQRRNSLLRQSCTDAILRSEIWTCRSLRWSHGLQSCPAFSSHVHVWTAQPFNLLRLSASVCTGGAPSTERRRMPRSTCPSGSHGLDWKVYVQERGET